MIDDTGFLKEGTHSARWRGNGVARCITNCQVGVFQTCPRLRVHALVGRELYLPEVWTGDSVYGPSSDPRDRSYVLVVAGNEHVRVGFPQVPVGDLWATLPEADWDPLACDWGPRYDWQCRGLAEPEDATWPYSLETLVAVAGTRWCLESALEAAKQKAGLDEYEVHITLSLWALALLWTTTLLDAPPVQKAPQQPGRRTAGPVAAVAARRAPHPPDPGLAGLVYNCM